MFLIFLFFKNLSNGSLAHIGIKGNEEAEKTVKQAMDMPGMAIRRAKNSEWQKEWENNTRKLHYIKPHIEEWESAHNSCRQYEVKLNRLHIGHTTRLTNGHLMLRNDQQQTCRNVA